MPLEETLKDRSLDNMLEDFFAYATKHLAPKTVKCYISARERVRMHFPDFLSKPYDEVRTIDIQRLLDGLERTYAKSTLNHIRAALSSAYKWSILMGKSSCNPAHGVALPKYAAVKVVHAFTADEEARILEASIGDPLGHIVQFYLITGLRLSELTNLRWRDWDTKGNYIFIRDSKTAAGVRKVPLIPEATLILYRLKCRKNSVNFDDFIFLNTRGNQLTEYSLRRTVQRISKASGVPELTIHRFRHTFATRMVENGAEIKALSLIIGHKSSDFTRARYVHPDNEFIFSQMMLISKMSYSKK